jgi:hypothetical protein
MALRLFMAMGTDAPPRAMKDIDLDTPLVLAEASLIWREADGEVIVLDKRTWSYLALNESGAELFKAIAAGTTRGGLVEQLCRTYELDAQSALRDVDAFVSTMQERQLVRLGDGD